MHAPEMSSLSSIETEGIRIMGEKDLEILATFTRMLRICEQKVLNDGIIGKHVYIRSERDRERMSRHLVLVLEFEVLKDTYRLYSIT